jgi:hypothetical protein
MRLEFVSGHRPLLQRTPNQQSAIRLDELPTHARGDGMGFGFHRGCVITNA